MHGVESFKIIDAQQAKLINNYRNTKYILLRTNAAVVQRGMQKQGYIAHCIAHPMQQLGKLLVVF